MVLDDNVLQFRSAEKESTTMTDSERPESLLKKLREYYRKLAKKMRPVRARVLEAWDREDQEQEQADSKESTEELS